MNKYFHSFMRYTSGENGHTDVYASSSGGSFQGRINHSGAPYQRKTGALFSYAKPRFSYLWRCTFFPKKVDDFLVVVTFKRTLNVQTSKQRGTNLAADRRGPLATGAPPMVQPAQWIIRSWLVRFPFEWNSKRNRYFRAQHWRRCADRLPL